MKVIYKNLLDVDSLQVDSLIDQEFGHDFSKTKKHQNYLGFAAEVEGCVIGVALARIEGNMGLLDLIVVHPSFRNRGIGKILFDKRLRLLFETEVDELVLFHWERKTGSLPKLAIKNSFKKHGIHKEYWKEDSIALGYACIECGDVCLCTAVEYRRKKKPQK